MPVEVDIREQRTPSGNSALPEDIVEAVGLSTVNSIDQQPAMLSNLGYSNTVVNSNLSGQNALANQQVIDQLGTSILGKFAALLMELDPLEAKSSTELLTGNTVSEEIADLSAADVALGTPNKPLPATTPDRPYYVEAPAYFVVTNASSTEDVRMSSSDASLSINLRP